MKKVCFLCLGLLILISCKVTDLSEGSGVIKGKISIGPLCPVETIPPRPECLPTAETYKTWQTAVWTLTRKKVEDLIPDSAGNYILKIIPGIYVIDFTQPKTSAILPLGSSNLPHTIHIANQDTIIFNINIDTGIR